MRVLKQVDAGVITLIPADDAERGTWSTALARFYIGDLLTYVSRSGADPRDPYHMRMALRFKTSAGPIELVASDEESEKAVRGLRDAIFFGGGGLIFTAETWVDGARAFAFTIGRCKICNNPIIMMHECEWKTCKACKEKCEHVYERGAMHGGGRDLFVGEFCSKCGTNKPTSVDEPEPPVIDQHIAVVEELGIQVLYHNYPGLGPHELKKFLTAPKVLIVEDNEGWWKLWGHALHPRVRGFVAESLEKAETMLPHLSDFALIVVDACVPGDDPNSMPLVRRIRAEGYRGPIIASSSVEKFRKLLLDAGCSHEVPKEEVPRLVVELLQV